MHSRSGAFPQGPKFRPASCIEDGEDDTANWAGFCVVEDLRQLGDDGDLIGNLHNERGKRYRSGFVPEGPIIITR